MYLRIFLSIVQCSAFVLTSSTKWHKNVVTVAAKERLVITCLSEDFGFFDVLRVGYSAPGKKEEIIAENSLLKLPYRSDSYSLKHELEGNTSKLHFTFKEVQSSDSGVYTCRKLSHNRDAPDKLKLTVNVPIKEVYVAIIDLEKLDNIKSLYDSSNPSFSTIFFSNLHPQEDGVSVEVQNGSGLLCYATSDSNDFRLETRLDEKVISTESFNGELFEHPRRQKDVESGDKMSDDEGAWKAVMFSQVDKMFNNKNFSCQASAPSFPPLLASVSVSVKFVPLVKCKQQKQVVEVGKESLICCSVIANPVAEVTWLDGDDPLTADDIKMQENLTAPDEKEICLMINKVESHHLRSFSIHASNSNGNSSFTLTLTLGKKPGTRAEPVLPTTNKHQHSEAGFPSVATTHLQFSFHQKTLLSALTASLLWRAGL